MAVHGCNPIYLGSRDRRIASRRLIWAKLARPYLDESNENPRLGEVWSSVVEHLPSIQDHRFSPLYCEWEGENKKGKMKRREQTQSGMRPWLTFSSLID
jgi:hypothetical protein